MCWNRNSCFWQQPKPYPNLIVLYAYVIRPFCWLYTDWFKCLLNILFWKYEIVNASNSTNANSLAYIVPCGKFKYNLWSNLYCKFSKAKILISSFSIRLNFWTYILKHCHKVLYQVDAIQTPFKLKIQFNRFELMISPLKSKLLLKMEYFNRAPRTLQFQSLKANVVNGQLFLVHPPSAFSIFVFSIEFYKSIWFS